MKQIETENSAQSKKLTHRFSDGSNRHVNSPNGGSAEERSHRYLGIERNSRKIVGRFKLLFRNGQITSVPYALLPIITYDPDQHLIIRMSGFEVRIKGRGLGKIEAYLSDEKLLWMKESGSEFDDPDEEVFIEQILIHEDE